MSLSKQPISLFVIEATKKINPIAVSSQKGILHAPEIRQVGLGVVEQIMQAFKEIQ